MAAVIGLRMVGAAYHNGRRMPGWNEITLDSGKTETVSNDSLGMDGVLDIADKRGYDTKRYRERLAAWVKTGVMPPA